MSCLLHDIGCTEDKESDMLLPVGRNPDWIDHVLLDVKYMKYMARLMGTATIINMGRAMSLQLS